MKNKQTANSKSMFSSDKSYKKIESEKKELILLIKNLPGAVYRCRNDMDWTIDYISHPIKKITGYAAALFMSKKILYNNLIIKKDREYVWKTVQIALKKKEIFKLTYSIITKGKNIKTILEQGCGVYDSKGKLKHLQGYVDDITENRKIDNEREKYDLDLKQKLSDLERLQRLSVGRELRIIELKNKIKELEEKHKKEEK